MKTLDDARIEIDAIDGQLVPLLVRRLQVVCDVAEAKRSTGASVCDPIRERAILDRVSTQAGPEYGDEVKAVFQAVFEVSKARQRSRLSGVEAHCGGAGANNK